MRAFRSEWIKLSRPSMWLGFGGAMVGFTLLFTALVFVDVAGTDVGLDDSAAGDFVSATVLSTADGALFSVTRLASFLGVFALALFASNLAGEFSRGTIRSLFVAEPRRLTLLAGKLAALASFMGVWLAAALVASVGLGAVLAPAAGVETSAWWTADGLAIFGLGLLNLTGAVLVPGLIGAALAVLTRSTAIAISVGSVYFILVEGLLGTFWSVLGDWGPAAAANVLALGGQDGAPMMSGADSAMSHADAALLCLGYSVVSVTVISMIMAKRDVTS